MMRLLQTIAAIGAGLAAASTCAAQASIQALGYLPGAEVRSLASDVSADGTVVIGRSIGLSSLGFRWVQGAGMSEIPPLPGEPNSSPRMVSASGGTVVGVSGPQAYLWTPGAGHQVLGFLPNTASNTPERLSGDGGTVLGVCGSTPYRWTAASGIQPLPPSPDERSLGVPVGVSDDGAVIAGALGGRSPYSAWVLRPTGLELLPDLGGPLGSTASAVSAQGAVLGRSHSPGGRFPAVRWGEANPVPLAGEGFWGTPMHSSADGLAFIGKRNTEHVHVAAGAVSVLSPPPGGTDFAPAGISDDGSRVWGTATRPGFNFPQPWVWHASGGSVWLTDALTAGGVNLTGWTIRDTKAMSRDGVVFVGEANTPAGNQQAYRAVLPR